MNLHNLGLAYRAKKIILGTDYVVDAMRKKKVWLVILAVDASELTKKKINDKAKTYQVEVLTIATADEISQALGGKNAKVIGIIDKGFSLIIK